MSEKKICFVVCPISEQGSDVRKRSDDLLEFIIGPVCSPLGYEVVRVDQIDSNDKIDQTILKYLRDAELVIADLTDSNPNAFYEIGYRSALDKPLIQMAHEGYVIPFDTATIRTIPYVTNDFGKAKTSKEKLSATVSNIEKQAETIKTIAETSGCEDFSKTTSNEILKLLFELKTSVEGLYPVISQSNRDTIKEVMATSYDAIKNSQPPQSTDALLMQEVFRNPKGLADFMQLFGLDPKDLINQAK